MSASAPIGVVDSHAHLEWPDFAADREAVLARARAAGVVAILAIGSAAGPERLDAAIPFAEQHDWVFATVGIHPQQTLLARPEHLDRLHELARHPRVIGFGEIGLDYYRDYAPRDAQQRLFRELLGVARSARLPVIIHCRAAWADTLEILGQEWRTSGLGGILHCFSGTLEDARRGMEMGFLISFAGNITYRKADALRELARALPLEALLVETDAPFLPPEGFRGQRNEPARVVEVARAVASVRNLGLAEFAAATTANFERLFRLRPSSLTGSRG
ncbi:MAG: TatD family hydrolase [Acidobacteriia bacterium]|jgi:TatD DNase family protein|nr:TatD family hydrolase [Terriglobia bacterium]